MKYEDKLVSRGSAVSARWFILQTLQNYDTSDKFPIFRHLTIIKNISQLNVRQAFQASYKVPRYPRKMLPGFQLWKASGTFYLDIFLIIVEWRKGEKLRPLSKFYKACSICQLADPSQNIGQSHLPFIFHPTIFLYFLIFQFIIIYFALIWLFLSWTSLAGL